MDPKAFSAFPLENVPAQIEESMVYGAILLKKKNMKSRNAIDMVID